MKTLTEKKSSVKTKSLFRFEKRNGRQEQETTTGTTGDPTTITMTLTSSCCPTGIF